MSGEYGPDYFTVKNRAGKDVAAKFLNDEYGNYIINPKTNKPYMVPANFDLKTFIDRYSLLSIMEDPIGGLVGPIPEVYITFFVNFVRGGQDDFQRSYNGYMGSTKDDADFVWAFTGSSRVAVSKMMKKENRP